jgi:hypothetical protein
MMSELQMIRHQRRHGACLPGAVGEWAPFATRYGLLLEVAQRKAVATKCRYELKVLDAGGPVRGTRERPVVGGSAVPGRSARSCPSSAAQDRNG